MDKEINKVYGDWSYEGNLGSGGFGVVQCWKNCRTGKKIGSYTNFTSCIFP